MYYTKILTSVLDIDTFINGYVEPEMYENCCKECPNYDKIYSCPPYPFDRISYLREFSSLELHCLQMTFEKKLLSKTFTQSEMKRLYDGVILPERLSFDRSLLSQENKRGNCTALYTGSCTFCQPCTRIDGQPCAYPEKMRYSIESLGGNVVGLARDFLGVEILWAKDKLPEYFLHVGGLLIR